MIGVIDDGVHECEFVMGTKIENKIMHGQKNQSQLVGGLCWKYVIPITVGCHEEMIIHLTFMNSLTLNMVKSPSSRSYTTNI